VFDLQFDDTAFDLVAFHSTGPEQTKSAASVSPQHEQSRKRDVRVDG